MELVKISEVKLNPNNPRLIKDDKFNCLTCAFWLNEFKNV